MFARRVLTQSLAREFHPQGVHVVHAITDGIIDVPRTRGYTGNSDVEDWKLKLEGVSVPLRSPSHYHDIDLARRSPRPTGICTLSLGLFLRRNWNCDHMWKSFEGTLGKSEHDHLYLKTYLGF